MIIRHKIVDEPDNPRGYAACYAPSADLLLVIVNLAILGGLETHVREWMVNHLTDDVQGPPPAALAEVIHMTTLRAARELREVDTGTPGVFTADADS